VRRGESRKIEYPFTKLKGRLKNRETNKTASFDANSVNPFNDKANWGVKRGLKNAYNRGVGGRLKRKGIQLRTHKTLN
jgi:hypothetical protein